MHPTTMPSPKKTFLARLHLKRGLRSPAMRWVVGGFSGVPKVSP